MTGGRSGSTVAWFFITASTSSSSSRLSGAPSVRGPYAGGSDQSPSAI